MKPEIEKIAFPDWPDPPIAAKRMTTDEYLAFVLFCWQNLPDRERVLNARLHDVPTVPFVIR